MHGVSTTYKEVPGRILMTTDTAGGVWSYSMELSKALSSYGIKVALAATGAPLSPEEREEAFEIPGIEVYESRCRLEWMEEPWDDVALAGEGLLELEKIFNPDIVHLNSYAHGALRFRAPKVVAGHSCVLSWWDAVKGGPPPKTWDRYREEVTRGIKAADLVVAPSEAMLSSLSKLYRVKGRVIYNGRSPAAFRPGVKEDFILTAGRLWDEAKNIQAIMDISESLPWPVYTAGDDRQKGVKENRRLKNSGAKRLGRLSSRALALWLSRASIYALPAHYEPFGLSVLEAGLSGCALVLGDIRSLREIWEGAAIFVPPGDGRALKEAIVFLVKRPGARKKLSQLARRRALEFSPDRMAEGYLSAYGALIAKAGPGAGREGSLCGL